ncbi:hypothetical protein, partial [Morganella morganii]|uniref:hypothetical protein n=1 Tax=Morganella morganii TaxID=582 RepID=UPI003EBFC6BB
STKEVGSPSKFPLPDKKGFQRAVGLWFWGASCLCEEDLPSPPFVEIMDTTFIYVTRIFYSSNK